MSFRVVWLWEDPRPKNARVRYRLSTDGTYYALERCERDRVGGDKWTDVGTIPRPDVTPTGKVELAAYLGQACELLAARVEALERSAENLVPRPRTVTSG